MKVSKKSAILLEGQFRYVHDFQPMQFQFRTGWDISVSKHWSIMPIGYAYSWNLIYGDQPQTYENDEHRTFEQVVYKHKIGRISLAHRLRLEQRFMQVHEVDNGEVVYKGYDLYLNRLRYRINAILPLSHTELEPKTLYAYLIDELFMDFGSNVVYTDPDQNRIFAGVGYQVNKLVSFQGGLVYQHLIKLTGTKEENNVGIHLLLQYNFDFTKKEN